MTYDVGVWHSDRPMTSAEAASYYRRINHDWVVVRRCRQFDDFWLELLRRLPDLRSPDSPPADLDAPPLSLLMSRDDLLTPPTHEQTEAVRLQAPPPEEAPWAATLRPTGSA